MYNGHLSRGTAYLTSGVGYGREKLSAFDAAELDANIMAANAVQVSSFIPPAWKISPDKAALKRLTGNGVFLPMAYAFSASHDCSVAASLAIGVNRNPEQASIIMEHAGLAMTRDMSLRISEINVQDAFSARHWSIDRLEKIAIDADPREGFYVCALVAVVLIAD
ncbi:MAG: pyruvoyl-dependent arginine decarboxylase [Gammaproteobacteria bacterium]